MNFKLLHRLIGTLCCNLYYICRTNNNTIILFLGNNNNNSSVLFIGKATSFQVKQYFDLAAHPIILPKNSTDVTDDAIAFLKV